MTQTTLNKEKCMELLRDAVRWCSQFAKAFYHDDHETKINTVRVRSADATGTNGHVLLIVPIKPIGIVEPRYLTPTEAVLFVHDPSVNHLPDLEPTPHGTYPDTDKMLENVRAVTPGFSVLLDPKYLELIGHTFRDMGLNEVCLIFRGKSDPVEVVGYHDDDEGTLAATAFVMPRKEK